MSIIPTDDTEVVRPPAPSVGVLGWLRHNLFRNVRDTALTVVAGAVALTALWRLVRYVFITGRWEAVEGNLALYLYGSYPRGELWRVAAVLLVGAGVGGLLAGVITRRRRDAAILAGERLDEGSVSRRVADVGRRLWPLLGLGVLMVALSETASPALIALATLGAAAAGRVAGEYLPRPLHLVVFALCVIGPLAALPFLTEPRGWDAWGGLMLTLLIAVMAMIASFPLGLVLALGRRSSLPAARALSLGIIEFFRGVPLVVLVLMGDVALGFFFPQSLLPGKVVRVIVAFTIFTAAYVAEIVRGGLQSVPRGQIEAAQALGMSPIRVTGWIVLPQALRNVIPALVGQFISLFKDTTLVFIIGFADVLSVAAAVPQQQDFQLVHAPEALAFAAVLFWVGSFVMSRESQRLEKRLGVGQR